MFRINNIEYMPSFYKRKNSQAKLIAFSILYGLRKEEKIRLKET